MNYTTRKFKVSDQRIHTGGMMRCCGATLDGWLRAWEQEDRVVDVNTTIQCNYAPDDPDHKWILDSTGTWRWLPKEAQA